MTNPLDAAVAQLFERIESGPCLRPDSSTVQLDSNQHRARLIGSDQAYGRLLRSMFAAIMWYPGSPFPSELLSNDLSAPQVFHLKRDQIRALQITVYQQNPKLSPGPGQPLQMIRLAFGCRHNNLAYQQRLEASLQPDGSTWLAGHLITTSKLPRATKELGPTEARYLTRLAWLSQELIRD